MNNFIPKHYTLSIEPDLHTFTCPGSVTIDGHLDREASSIRLDARDLEIHRTVVQVGEEPEVEVAFSVLPEQQALELVTPLPVQVPVRVTVEFTARISDGLAGLYRSSYQHQGETRYMAVTQFEETDARAAFPCVDEPGAKAVFDVEFVVEDNVTGICNTRILSDEPRDDGKHRIRFAPTPPMSTYLLFFGVGDFDFSIDHSWRIPVRCATRPGQAHYGRDAMKWTIESLRFGEEYTGHSFPIDKMDLIACPDFAFGAMENYGAISFRENRVLIWPDVTPAAERERVCQITNHEVAHMWFGDLVSPKDWSYVWLNEAFATYFGYVITDAFHPEFEGLEQFIANQMNVAFHRDALRPTIPVEFPDGQELEFGPATTPIIYRKAASILRMFRLYLGDCALASHADGDATTDATGAAFRAGVRAYVDAHAHGTADTDGFLETFENGVHSIEGAPEFKKEVLGAWIRTPGYPLLTAHREGQSLHIRTSRFTYLPEDAAGPTPPVPLTIRYVYGSGKTDTASILLTEPQQTLPIPEGAEAVKLNADQAGFYRVAYDEGMLEQLGIASNARHLGPRDRYGILYDLHALCVSGRMAVREYLATLSNYFAHETEFLPAYQIARSLTALFSHAGEHEAAIAATGREVLKSVLREVGTEPAEGEPHTHGILRTEVVWALYLFSHESVCTAVTERAEALCSTNGASVTHPDLRALYYRVAACESESHVRTMMSRITDNAVGESEAQEITMALGHVPDAALLSQLLDFTMTEIPARNRFLFLSSASGNTRTGECMWDWFLAHQDAARKLPRFHFLSALVLFARSAPATRTESVREYFASCHKKDPTIGNETLEMAREEHLVRCASDEHVQRTVP